MQRREFLRHSLGTAAAAGLVGWRPVTLQADTAPATRPRGKAPFRLWYNNDTTNILGVESPFHRKGEPFTDEALIGSIDEVADKGVDAYALSPGLGRVPFWKSDVYPDHHQWWMKQTGLEPDAYGRYLLDGGDMVATLVRRCRHHGMAPIVSLRMNDVHLLENVGRKTPKSIWVSRFYEEHPEYWLEADHPTKHPQGYYHRRGQDWAIAAVRQRKLDFLTELCENYDLDGLELDWLRDQNLFRADFGYAERKAILTEFHGQVRAVLDRTTPEGRRCYLSVRVPVSLDGCRAFGFDVAEAVAAGVDILNCSGWYFAQPRTNLPEFRRLAPNAAILHELTHAAGSLRLVESGRSGGYGTDTFPRTSPTMYRTAANLAYQRGADGISLFNFVYYRMGTEPLDWLKREPPFDVLPTLRQPVWLAKQPQLYWLGRWTYVSEIGGSIAPAQSRDYQFDIALPQRSLADQVPLRVVCAEPLPSNAELEAELNGKPLEANGDTSSPYNYAYDRLLGPTTHRRAWSCPSTLLRNGMNTVRLSLKGTEVAVRPEWLDLAVS